MKKSFITALFLLTSAAELQAADDTTVTDDIVENVLINFGSGTGGGEGWNNVEGTRFDSKNSYWTGETGYGLETGELTSDDEVKESSIDVQFDSGNSLLGGRP